MTTIVSSVPESGSVKLAAQRKLTVAIADLGVEKIVSCEYIRETNLAFGPGKPVKDREDPRHTNQPCLT